MTSNFLETNKLCLKKKAKAKETTFVLKEVEISGEKTEVEIDVEIDPIQAGLTFVTLSYVLV